jgi:hypothetical protein
MVKKGKKELSFNFEKFRVKEFRTLLFLIILITVLTFIGYIFKGVVSTPIEQEETFLIVRSIGGTTVELIEPGKTPFDTLMDLHVTQIEQLPGEVLIKCIDNVCGGNDYNWIYYVNNEIGNVKISEYIIQAGDDIEFRLIGAEV